MSADAPDPVRAAADAIYRAESRRVFATLIRLLGDFDLAEEALHDGFRAALEQWPRDGIPANPRAWLVSAGRFKAIDGIRRRSRFDSMEDVAEQVDAVIDAAVESAVRFMELHKKHWPGWEGETEVRQMFGPEDFGPEGCAPAVAERSRATAE
jgi:DNA-directed RNA polymerase specialized sigma24 family protein